MDSRLALVLLLTIPAATAQAQECAPAKLLATVPMHDAEPESNIRTVPGDAERHHART